jgi:hypothetical protein
MSLKQLFLVGAATATLASCQPKQKSELTPEQHALAGKIQTISNDVHARFKDNDVDGSLAYSRALDSMVKANNNIYELASPGIVQTVHGKDGTFHVPVDKIYILDKNHHRKDSIINIGPGYF